MKKSINKTLGLILIALGVTVLFIFLIPQPDISQQQKETIHTGTVTEIINTTEIQFEQRPYIQQELQVSLPQAREELTVSSDYLPENTPARYETGDRVLIGTIAEEGLEDTYFLVGYDRTHILVILAVLFLLTVLLVTKKQGLKALFSMGFSFVVILTFILPLILRGLNPLLVSIIGVATIIPLSFFLTHGFQKKTLSAVLGTIISLCVTGILANIIIHNAKLTGITTEEIEILFFTSDGTYNLAGLLIAGILIGALGILDDVTIAQSSLVSQLKEASPKISHPELFKRAMAVGRDHISSVVNTLILVYTGASLSTLLLFLTYPRPLLVLLNNETVVIQIVIALVGSIGLIIAVPITTYITIWLSSRRKVHKT